MHWRNRDKQNDEEHHEKARFFIYLSFTMFFCFAFLRKCPFHMLHVMLFVHVVKRLNSRSEMFFKTGVLIRNIHRKTPVLKSLFDKLQDWRFAFSFQTTLQHRWFPMNMARFLKTAFLWNTGSLYFSEILCDDGY